MAAEYDITIEQGATFAFAVTVTGVNLTGYAASMQGRTQHAATTTVFSLTSPSGGLVITAGTNSIITVTMSATATAALTAPAEGVYDLEYSSGGVVTRILQGMYRITPEVTR